MRKRATGRAENAARPKAAASGLQAELSARETAQLERDGHGRSDGCSWLGVSPADYTPRLCVLFVTLWPTPLRDVGQVTTPCVA